MPNSIQEYFMHGGDPDIAVKRETLTYAVQRLIFCPYTGALLDVRSTVMLDGSEHGQGMHVMTAEAWDSIKDSVFGEGKLNADDYEVLDGRELFS